MIDFLRPRTALRATDEIDAGAYAEESDDHWPPMRAGRTAPLSLGVAAHGKIGLLEHCGTGNLGDDATVEAVLQQIKARWPAASVVGLSLDPVDSEKRHGIPCVAIRQSIFPFRQEWASAAHPLKRGRYLDSLKARLKKTGPLFQVAKAIKNWMIVPPLRLVREIMFLVRSFSLARELDLLVICGGGQLLDWGGPWAFPYTLLKWNALAKCAGARCIFLNNGAGPLDARLSRWFVIRALAMADYVSTRDRSSAEFLRKVGFKGKISVVADSAWDLRLPDGLRMREARVQERTRNRHGADAVWRRLPSPLRRRHWLSPFDRKSGRILLGTAAARTSDQTVQQRHLVRFAGAHGPQRSHPPEQPGTRAGSCCARARRRRRRFGGGIIARGLLRDMPLPRRHFRVAAECAVDRSVCHIRRSAP